MSTKDAQRPGLDIAELQPCAICGQGIMGVGVPFFWRVTLERLGVDRFAVQQNAGLEMMMGGNIPLARVFSPSTEIAKPLEGIAPVTILVCEGCAAMETSVYQLGLRE